MLKKNSVLINVLANFTLAKFLSALITITLLATIKYIVTGNFYIDYSNFFTNIGVGLLSFTINTGFFGLLSEYLGINGINFNLKELIFGFETIQMGDAYSSNGSDKLKTKVYLAMESNEEPNPNIPLDKGKGVQTTLPSSTEDRNFSSPFLPKTNPGPGFNVPGGVVPIRDDICKSINYNTHILNQIKTMDLETAIEQRDNNLKLINMMDQKLAFSTNALAGVPAIPTTEYEFRLKNQIHRDLKEFTDTKNSAEGRTALLNSRIEFIIGQIRKN